MWSPKWIINTVKSTAVRDVLVTSGILYGEQERKYKTWLKGNQYICIYRTRETSTHNGKEINVSKS